MIGSCKVTVRYAETDQMGIAHHSVYPIWYEVARTEFIKQIGMTYSEMEAMGIMSPLIELNCKYSIPANYEDELTIQVKIGKLTPARVEFLYEVYKEGYQKPINTGITVHAWVGKDLRPLNMKKHFSQVYQSILNIIET